MFGVLENMKAKSIEDYAIPVVYNPDFKPFDVRKASEKIKELGRPLTNEELQEFYIEK